jgi:hypothetical protein
MEEILLQCIGIGCLFLHELPLMYHELSLIVLGVLHQGADDSSSHVMPALACAMAGIYGCGLSLSSFLL